MNTFRSIMQVVTLAALYIFAIVHLERASADKELRDIKAEMGV